MTWLGQKSEAETARPVSSPTHTHTPTPSSTPQTVASAPRSEPFERTEARKLASIGKSLKIKGELTGSEDLTIEGQVDGKITLNGYSVTIGQNGRVTAEIQAKSIIVGGQVKGNVVAEERVEVLATGSMLGDVRAPRVALADGARFKGSIDMESKGAAATTGTTTAAATTRVAAGAQREETPMYMSETAG